MCFAEQPTRDREPLAGIVGIITLLTVLALSLAITRLATVALTLTGLSGEAARFQARSAFTGTGFTTSESEHVVNHPVRRRIIMLLMILRSAGLVTILISLILSFVGPGTDTAKLLRLLGVVAGVIVLWLLARSSLVTRGMERLMGWALSRWTNLDVRDYASLLRLSGNYTVMEVQVREGDWLAGKKLADCNLPEEGVSVLGIYRHKGGYVGAPRGNTEIYPQDTVILYGRSEALRELDTRRSGAAGDAAHTQAVGKQEQHVEQQQREEAEHRRRREEKGR